MVETEQLELRQLPAEAARIVVDDRKTAGRIIGAVVPDEWPLPDLAEVIHLLKPPFGAWVMVERTSGAVVGDIGFMGPPDETGAVEVGYSVLPDRRRRGYATEAARGIVAWALDQPGVKSVTASCDPHNAGSIKTLERAGFARTGEREGLLRWRYP